MSPDDTPAVGCCGTFSACTDPDPDWGQCMTSIEENGGFMVRCPGRHGEWSPSTEYLEELARDRARSTD